jgi:hypothetical protein
METYVSKTGEKVVIRGGPFEIEDLIHMARNHAISDWTITYKVAPEQVNRKVIIFSNAGKRIVNWVEYRNIIRNRDGRFFIYDGIKDRFYLPDGKLKSALSSPVICDVLTYLAKNPHGHSALEISADLDFDQKDGPAAIRQAIRRMRKIAPDLVSTEQGGYRLNPDYRWFIIEMTGA